MVELILKKETHKMAIKYRITLTASNLFSTYLLNSEPSMKRVDLRRQASTFDACHFFIFRETGSAAGAFPTHIDDILGCS